MKRFEKYLERMDIETRKVNLKNDYFYNVDCPECIGIYCFFEYDSEIAALENETNIKRIRNYCRRYGYLIINEKCYYHDYSFMVVNASDFESLKTYQSFVSNCADACARYAHEHKKDPDINKSFKMIMSEYEKNYLDFLQAIA